MTLCLLPFFFLCVCVCGGCLCLFSYFPKLPALFLGPPDWDCRSAWLHSSPLCPVVPSYISSGITHLPPGLWLRSVLLGFHSVSDTLLAIDLWLAWREISKTDNKHTFLFASFYMLAVISMVLNNYWYFVVNSHFPCSSYIHCAIIKY